MSKSMIVRLCITPFLCASPVAAQRVAPSVVAAKPDTSVVAGGTLFILTGDTLVTQTAAGTSRILIQADTVWQLSPGPKKRLDAAAAALLMQFIAHKRNTAEFRQSRKP